MNKHITVKLTIDQANTLKWLVEQELYYKDNFDNSDQEAFLIRLLNKLKQD